MGAIISFMSGTRGATTAEYALANLRKSRCLRRIDDLGRVVLPIEARRRLDLVAGDALEVIDVPGGIFLRPVVRAGRVRF